MYFVTMIQRGTMDRWAAFMEHRVFPSHVTTPRTVGYFATQQRAAEVVESHGAELHSRRYPWCVIEGFASGLYPVSDDDASLWFEWNGARYVRCPRPEATRRISNIALG